MKYFLWGLTIVAIAACRQAVPEPADVDIQFKRFEKDLFAISNYDIGDSIPYLTKKYPSFFPLFTSRVLEIGTPGQPGFTEGLLAFKSDFTIYRANKRVEGVFADFTPFEEGFTTIFGRYKALFPGQNIPTIITCISGFNQSVIITENILAVSLDKYLGASEEFYDLLYPPVPAYQRKKMEPQKIVPDALYAWLVTEYSFDSSRDDLLSNMIYQGRAMYALSVIMPELSDTLLWGYSQKEIKYLKTNERNMWEYLVEQKLLFSTDKFRIGQFINPAPFTKDFSGESPGQAANWIGYQIVRSYMKNNEDISLQQLMQENDYLQISNLAKYNP